MGPPFVPMDPRWWVNVIAALTKPWPYDAVWFDLRWWRDQEIRKREDHRGRRIRLPGRPALMKRWGWTDTAVKNVLKAERLWRDPYKVAFNQQSTSTQPGGDQDATSEQPGIEPQVDDFASAPTSEQPGSDQGPARVQPASPHARSIPPIHRSTDPPIHPSPEGGAGGDEHAQQTNGHSHPATDAALRQEHADPGELAEQWRVALAETPPALRGKGIGFSAAWPIELLELGPEEAAVAVAAVVELCRGTETRAPCRLDWARFFGQGSRLKEGGWQDAYAWKTAGAGEPALGRTWRGHGDRRGDRAGSGQAGAAARRDAGVIIGEGPRDDPRDPGVTEKQRAANRAIALEALEAGFEFEWDVEAFGPRPHDPAGG